MIFQRVARNAGRRRQLDLSLLPVIEWELHFSADPDPHVPLLCIVLLLGCYFFPLNNKEDADDADDDGGLMMSKPQGMEYTKPTATSPGTTSTEIINDGEFSLRFLRFYLFLYSIVQCW